MVCFDFCSLNCMRRGWTRSGLAGNCSLSRSNERSSRPDATGRRPAGACKDRRGASRPRQIVHLSRQDLVPQPHVSGLWIGSSDAAIRDHRRGARPACRSPLKDRCRACWARPPRADHSRTSLSKALLAQQALYLVGWRRDEPIRFAPPGAYWAHPALSQNLQPVAFPYFSGKARGYIAHKLQNTVALSCSWGPDPSPITRS